MPAERPKRSGAPSRRYAAAVGLAFVILIVIATLNTIRTEGGGILGVTKGDRGMPLPEFAVPNAVNGPLDRDANIAQDDCATSENPCPSGSVRDPACEIPRQGAIRVCDLFDKPLVLSFWFTKGADCLPTQDALNRVATRFRGRVNFLSLDVRDDPQQVRDIVAQHGWTIPVGYDRDGAVSDLYRVGGCPTVAFAYPGGILAFAKIKSADDQMSEPALTRDTRRLVSESRARQREER